MRLSLAPLALVPWSLSFCDLGSLYYKPAKRKRWTKIHNGPKKAMINIVWGGSYLIEEFQNIFMVTPGRLRK